MGGLVVEASPFSTLTSAILTLRVLTSVSWPRRMRVLDFGATGCVSGQLRNVKFRDSSDVRSNWLVKAQGRHTTLAIQVWVATVGQLG